MMIYRAVSSTTPSCTSISNPVEMLGCEINSLVRSLIDFIANVVQSIAVDFENISKTYGLTIGSVGMLIVIINFIVTDIPGFIDSVKSFIRRIQDIF